MRFKLKTDFALVALTVVMGLASAPSHAVTISGLFNTGTDASNLALTGGNGVVDTHYQILSSTSPGYAGNQAVTYFHSAYAANDANSRWISLSANGSPGGNTTVYRTTFDLTGFDPLTALITGNWGVDNAGSIILNGVYSGISHTGFSSLVSFSLNSGFVAGMNTLDFEVRDFGQPTALRVDDLAGTANLYGPGNTVPEPTSIALLSLGLLGLAARRRKSLVSASCYRSASKVIPG